MESGVKVGKFGPPVTQVKEEEEEVGRYVLIFISLTEGKTTKTDTLIEPDQ